MRAILTLLGLLLLTACSRSPATITTDDGQTQMQVCFTPGEDCTTLLVDQINAAQKSIEVEAYTFTSFPIAKALVQAAARGVEVQVILDKTQFDGQHFSVAPYLQKKGIPLYEDNQVNIAHNKIMIFDQNTIETGSFNFTKAAQNNNAENMLIIRNALLAKAYIQNFDIRQKQSQPIHFPIPMAP